VSTFLLIPVNEQGTFFDRMIAPILQESTAPPARFSRLFLFSHGWWTNASRAMVDYDRFITGFTRCLLDDAYAQPLAKMAVGDYFACGMHWPSVLTEDSMSVLNYAEALTFFTMRARADTVGENAAYAALNVALRSGTVGRINLIGHSFGCRVVCSAVQKLLTNDPACLDNLDVRIILLEPAFDQEDLEWGEPNTPRQRYDLVLQNPHVRMLITRSSLDVALSVGYPLANVIGDVVNHVGGDAVEAVARELLSRVDSPLAAAATATGILAEDVTQYLHDVWNRFHPQSPVTSEPLQAPVATIVGGGGPKALKVARLVLAALEAAHVSVALAAGGAGLRDAFVARLGGHYQTFEVGPSWAGPPTGVGGGPRSVLVADLSPLHARPGGETPPWNDHHSDIFLPEIYRLAAWYLFTSP
jgi:hypothetical protein